MRRTYDRPLPPLNPPHIVMMNELEASFVTIGVLAGSLFGLLVVLATPAGLVLALFLGPLFMLIVRNVLLFVVEVQQFLRRLLHQAALLGIRAALAVIKLVD